MNLEVLAEAFNLFNRTHITSVNTTAFRLVSAVSGGPGVNLVPDATLWHRPCHRKLHLPRASGAVSCALQVLIDSSWNVAGGSSQEAHPFFVYSDRALRFAASRRVISR